MLKKLAGMAVVVGAAAVVSLPAVAATRTTHWARAGGVAGAAVGNAIGGSTGTVIGGQWAVARVVR